VSAAAAPEHVPQNLWQKLRERVWAYQSLSRWTPDALDRALADVQGAQNRNAYLGYSTDGARRCPVYDPFADALAQTRNWRTSSGVTLARTFSMPSLVRAPR
jgi:hypothetical protein